VPVGVVIVIVVFARSAGDSAFSSSVSLPRTEAGRTMGIFELLVVLILAYIDSGNRLSVCHKQRFRHVSVRGVVDAETRKRLKVLL
jgi:hypothetical protein